MKRVQYRIKPLAFANERPTSSKAVHTPHHAYMGRKGTWARAVNWKRAPMKARVRPVGARNVIGWPVMVAYAMPDMPHEPTVWGAPPKGGV